MASEGEGQRGESVRPGANFLVGHAPTVATASQTNGWFIGSFMRYAPPALRTEALEVKWGVHARGDERAASASSAVAWTLTLLLSGRFLMLFDGRERAVQLVEPGDFVIYGPGIGHRWRAIDSSTVLTVRWPSSVADGGPE